MPAFCGRVPSAAPGSPISTRRRRRARGCPWPDFQRFADGGLKSLFRLPLKGPPLPRLVLTEAAIDALSVAASRVPWRHALRRDRRRHRAGHDRRARGAARDIATLPDALFCSATDANGPGDRFADRHRSLAEKFGIPFARLRPPIEGGDWNDVLRRGPETRG